MKATEQCFPACGAVYYAVQDGSNFWVCGWNPKVWPFKWKLLSRLLSCGAVYYAVQGGSNVWVCGWSPQVWPFKWKLLSSTFPRCCLLCCTRWFYLLSLGMKSSSVTFKWMLFSSTFPRCCWWHCEGDLTFESPDKWKFPVVLFIMWYKVSVEDTLECDHVNESY